MIWLGWATLGLQLVLALGTGSLAVISFKDALSGNDGARFATILFGLMACASFLVIPWIVWALFFIGKGS